MCYYIRYNVWSMIHAYHGEEYEHQQSAQVLGSSKSRHSRRLRLPCSPPIGQSCHQGRGQRGEDSCHSQFETCTRAPSTLPPVKLDYCATVVGVGCDSGFSILAFLFGVLVFCFIRILGLRIC